MSVVVEYPTPVHTEDDGPVTDESPRGDINLQDDMGKAGRGTGRRWVLPLILVIVAYLYMLPSPIDPQIYSYNDPPVLEGALQKNNHLQKCKKLFEGQLVGPESFTVDKNGTVYTGLQDGRIVAFQDTMGVRTVVHTGQKVQGCGSFDLEPVCGRPKGMKMDNNGHLLVLDSYKGLLRVDPHNGSAEYLISSQVGVNGVPFSFLNGLDINKEGLVYFTDSTTRWDRRNYRYEVLEVNNLGRLMVYNPTTRQTEVLLDKLYLANGVALSRDESFLLVAEMSVCRIRRYFLKGPKKGQSEIFADNLPGYPDNIKINNKGNFYVGMGAVRYKGVSKLGPFLDLVGPYPAMKRFIAKVIPLALFDVFVPKHSMILEYNSEGELVSSLHDPTGAIIPAAGEAFQVNNNIYIGNFKNPFIGQLDVTDIH